MLSTLLNVKSFSAAAVVLLRRTICKRYANDQLGLGDHPLLDTAVITKVHDHVTLDQLTGAYAPDLAVFDQTVELGPLRTLRWYSCVTLTTYLAVVWLMILLYTKPLPKSSDYCFRRATSFNAAAAIHSTCPSMVKTLATARVCWL